MQHRYAFYATILDRFRDYRDSDLIWERYWGFSDNPPQSPEEFRESQFHDLIDRINRVPYDSEAADKGTAFNEVVDCLIEHRKSGKVKVERVFKKEAFGTCDPLTGKPEYYDEHYTDEVVGLNAEYNNRTFYFPLPLVREFAGYFHGAVTQQYVEATLPTAYGDVLLYGFIDELMPLSVHDIKTTNKYHIGKYKNNMQHLVYPYCLMRGGSDVRTFEYNVAELGKYSYSTYTETYVFDPDRDIPRLREHCEDFIRFLMENRDKITDKKIFGGNNNG